jgi:type IV pilus assembly protein PilZ
MSDDSQVTQCIFNNERALFLSYMPFVKDGGLFIHTKTTYELGDKVTMSIKFFEDSESHLVEGKVVWITPKGAQGNKPAGIGVQFTSENKRQVCNVIETRLAGLLKSAQPTDTM